MTTIEIDPIGQVFCEVARDRDDGWGSVISEIGLDHHRFDSVALEGLWEFSHVEVFFQFDQINESEIERG